MARRTKNPEERKDEFISVAHSLFAEKGFEKTSVDDIVDSMGVAKGLFYYYFDSKDDVLYAIVDEMLNRVSEDVEEIMSLNYDSPAIQILVLFKPYSKLGDQSMKLLEYFRNERNQEFYNYFLREARNRVKPALISIIEKGVENGEFAVKYVPETADMLLSIGGELVRRPGVDDGDRWENVRFDIGGRLLGIDPELLRTLDKTLNRPRSNTD